MASSTYERCLVVTILAEHDWKRVWPPDGDLPDCSDWWNRNDAFQQRGGISVRQLIEACGACRCGDCKTRDEENSGNGVVKHEKRSIHAIARFPPCD